MTDSGELSIERIRSAFVGRRFAYLESTDSTNDEAWCRIGEARSNGLVVLAEHQSKGRGRMGRSWQSPRGAGVLMSVLLLDAYDKWRGEELALLAAVAACDGVRTSTGVDPRIKWPNDLLVNGLKLGGILVESRIMQPGSRAYVIGIGINCLQPRGLFVGGLAESATSLDLESDRAIDRSAVVIEILRAMDQWLASDPRDAKPDLRDAWLSRCEPMGMRVRLRHRGSIYTGTMIDIDPRAALVLELDGGGRRAFEAADTTILDDEETGLLDRDSS